MQIILSVKVELVDTAAGSNLRRRLHWLEVASDVTGVEAKNNRSDLGRVPETVKHPFRATGSGARARDGETPVQSRIIL